MRDYIPRADAELMEWSANFYLQVSLNADLWDISANDVIRLKTAVDDFAECLALADSPKKNVIITAEKNASRKVLIGIIRGLVNFPLKNPVISVVERVALGLRVYATTRTTIPAPTLSPVFNINIFGIHCLSVDFYSIGSRKKAKPHGISGAVIAYSVLDAPPASPVALTRSVLATRTPHTLEFIEEERGQKVYIAICWQNAKGEKGPWSNIESAIVP
jgi:hypothetical protein